MKSLFHVLIFGLLTALTQIGGLAYFVTLIAAKTRSRRLALFVATYVAVSIATVFIAPIIGRVTLPCTENSDGLKMQSLLYCALNRHYVTPEMAEVANALSRHMKGEFPGTVTLALDGNFPFFDGFPLLPHLSHDDGDKLDFAFYYEDEKGRYLPGITKSPIGYWGFEQLVPDGAQPCRETNNLSMRWDLDWLQPLLRDYILDEARTREALSWLANEGPKYGVSKIFLEPHLKQSLRLTSDRIRFQGCNAARHDDHIHIQM